MPTSFRLPFLLLTSLLLSACASTSAPSLTTTQAKQIRQQLLQHYQAWRGTPYAWGGQTKQGIDCSGFVQLIFAQHFFLPIPRTTGQQAEQGQPIKLKQLQAGDLVFFKPSWKGRHVGIYIGEQQFLHASTRHGVTLSRLDSDYWRKAYWKARRLPLP